MSNKIVPQIYRAIIDDVISSIKSEFDSYGIEESVLGDLQTKWENKVVASHVAEFDAPAANSQQPPQQQQHHPQQHHYPPHHYPHHVLETNQHQLPPGYAPYVPPPPPTHPQVKPEPVDNRYTLAPPIPTYTLPALPGPQLNGASRPPTTLPVPTGSYPVAMPGPSTGPPRPLYTTQPQGAAPQRPVQQQGRIPQTDGPSSSGSESSSPPPNHAPRSAHPSLPQPQAQPAQLPEGRANAADTEEINSDLDDSDTDGEDEDQDGTLGETDTVLCTYDKVARVKNKWKCVLKDGMVHVNNKDYLFAKCTCEFEW